VKTPGLVVEVVDQGALPELQVDAAALGLQLDDQQLLQLAEFARLLLRWNRAFNIISRRDEARLTTRHLLDSLSIVPWVRGLRVLDMGTGGGLPGVPLAICCRDQQFTLLDRTQRKIRFVTQVKRALGLENVEPVCADVRELSDGALFDCVVSRAVADPETNWQLAAPRLRGGGRLLIMASTGGVIGASSGDFSNQRRSSGRTRAIPDLGAPEGSRYLTREHLQIPGLSRAHRLDVLMRAAESDMAE
jgi:16S rRNA (guanine527-N7)-methyltransferase